jgi:EAL domain-containing protein (putative c-di-GMP-specific phosphodiesterase class I)
MGIPWLEFFPQQGGPVQKTLLTTFPFSIGRNDTTDLPINSTRVSREHAVIVRAGNTFRVRDLDSTNGTSVNGQRIEEATLSDGDILAVADIEFTFFSGNVQAERKTVTQVIGFREASSTDLLAADVIRSVRRLQETLLQSGMMVNYHAIVDLSTGKPIGLEAIPKSHESKSSEGDTETQILATQSRLSLRLRQSYALVAAEHVAGCSLEKVFLPLAANELERRLVEPLLARLSGILPEPSAIVLDIPDSAVNDIPYFHDLHACVRDRGAQLCYSEFAAGKAQINVHRKVPPNYVKLSRAMMRGLSNDTSRQAQLEGVIRTIRDLDGEPIVTEIDSEAAARVFRRLGCRLAMGPYYESQSAINVTPKPNSSARQQAVGVMLAGLDPVSHHALEAPNPS